MKTTAIYRLLVFGLLALPALAQSQGVVFGRLTTGGTDLQLNAGAQDPSISPDGRYIALVSTSNNIGPPFNGSLNVYRYDLVADQYLLATAVLGGGNSNAPSISAGGGALAFESQANNLAPGNPSGFSDVFYSQAGPGSMVFTTALVSKGVAGVAPNGQSRYASVSANGRFVAFYSDASNLINGDSNAAPDIFVGDALNLFAAEPERISVNNGGAQINGPSRALSPSAISNDGRFVAFAVDTPVSIDGSNAGTLEDVFVRDRVASTTSLISKSTAGVAGNSSSDQAAISPNGRYVVFRSFSTLVAAPSDSRIYVRDRQNSSTSNMPLPAGATNCEDPRISDVGDIVSQCSMSNQVSQQAFLYRAAGTGTFYRLSTSLSFTNGNGSSGNYTGISADFMVFDSAASDLVPFDSNNTTDAFVAADAEALNRIFANRFEGVGELPLP